MAPRALKLGSIALATAGWSLMLAGVAALQVSARKSATLHSCSPSGHAPRSLHRSAPLGAPLSLSSARRAGGRGNRGYVGAAAPSGRVVGSVGLRVQPSAPRACTARAHAAGQPPRAATRCAAAEVQQRARRRQRLDSPGWLRWR